MQEFYPVFWLILGLALAIIEALTVQLVAIWFSLGAVAAIVPAVLGAPMRVQVFIFLAVALLTLIFSRKFAMRFLKVKPQHTNADRVLGEIGVVVEDIDNDAAEGRIAVMGLNWSARSTSNKHIATGQKVKVIAIDGVKLMVEPLEPSIGATKEEA